MIKINQFEVWIADLNPQIGTETGKIRPVVVVQSNLLNSVEHPSTLVCPITTNVKKEVEILRVHLPKIISKLDFDSDIMIDQLRAIDNKRLIKKISILPKKISNTVIENIKILLEEE